MPRIPPSHQPKFSIENLNAGTAKKKILFSDNEVVTNLSESAAGEEDPGSAFDSVILPELRKIPGKPIKAD